MSRNNNSKPAAEPTTEPAEAVGDTTPVVAVNGQEPDVSDPSPAPAASSEEVPTMAELTGIRYVGMADHKTFTVEDLEAMGVESPKGDLEWTPANGRVVSSSELNAATRDALLADPNFLAV